MQKRTLITAEIADAIQNSGAPFVWVEERDESQYQDSASNMMVDLQAVVISIRRSRSDRAGILPCTGRTGRICRRCGRTEISDQEIFMI